jgi:hypothetical protein
MPAKKKPETDDEEGLSLASQATMMAVILAGGNIGGIAEMVVYARYLADASEAGAPPETIMTRRLVRKTRSPRILAASGLSPATLTS